MTVTFKGTSVSLVGKLPSIGQVAPEFTLVQSDLMDISLVDFKGKQVVLNIFPSLDTGTCAASVRAFNKIAQDRGDVVVLHISMDLPFAQKRFCQADAINQSKTLSAYRSSFADDYGLRLLDTPLKGLCTRAVLVLGGQMDVIYSELVAEITNEPDYDQAIAALS